MDLCNTHYSQMYQYGKLLEKTIHDHNEYIIDGDITEIVLVGRGDNETGRTIINTKHLDVVKQYKWRLNNSGYAMSGDRILLHRLITNAPKGMEVDHKDHCTLNNLDNNLRVCTRSENQLNQSIKSNNTSGFKGVTWHKKMNQWVAQIMINGKSIYLGASSNIQEAIDLRKSAETKYHGEFSYDASINKA